MIINPLEMQIKHSIFIKISLTVVSAILITILMVVLFSALIIHHYNTPQSLHQGLANNMTYLIDVLSNITDVQKMREIAETYQLMLYYAGPGSRWSSGNFPDLRISERIFNQASKNKQYIFQSGYFFIKKTNGPHLYILACPIIPRKGLAVYYILILIGILTVTLIFLYFMIRKILYPVHYLTDGIRHIQEGDFSYQIRNDTRSDELGDLIRSFNRMTRLIGELLRSKDQLLLDVSHELRSPITRIKVALEFIHEEKIRQTITEDLAEMEQMIHELLETERMKSSYGKLQFKNTDLTALIRKLAGGYQDHAPGLSVDLPDHEVFLAADALRIEILLKNILNNAFRYSRTGSQPVVISLQETEDDIKIIIKDNGIGISPHDIPCLFEPFYRTDQSRSKETGGYGLGLYLAKKIVQYHQGEITAESREHEGTSFFIRLPKLKSLS